MHNASYWKGVRNTFILLFGVALIVSTYFIWQADMLDVFGGYVVYPQFLEPFRWMMMFVTTMGGGVMVFMFLDESYDFDWRFRRKEDTVTI